MAGERALVATSQSLNASKTEKQSILKAIKDKSTFQDFIKQLEEKNLIWYFVGPLIKDEDITKQINSQWKKDFERFKELIDKEHGKLKPSLAGQNFLVYPKNKNGNHFQIRLESKSPELQPSKSSELQPTDIGSILRAGNEGDTYYIPLGEGSQITASKKNDNKRHYTFTGLHPGKMIIDWHADGIDCSITVEVNEDGISDIKAVSFGRLSETLDQDRIDSLILNNAGLVDAHKEVYLNGSSISKALKDYLKKGQNQYVGESISQPEGESISPKIEISERSRSSSISSDYYSGKESDGEEEVGSEGLSVSNDPGIVPEVKSEIPSSPSSSSSSSSSGRVGGETSRSRSSSISSDYGPDDEEKVESEIPSPPSSLRRSSFSGVVGDEGEVFEADNEDEHETKEQENGISELEKENAYLKKQIKELQNRNEKVVQEGDEYRLKLGKSEERVKEFETKLNASEEARRKELTKKDEEIKELKQKIVESEKSLGDKDSEIKNLNAQLEGAKSNVQLANNPNEELQNKLDQTEEELKKAKEENQNLANIILKQFERSAEQDQHLGNQKGTLKKLEEQSQALLQKNKELMKDLADLKNDKEQLENALGTANQQPSINETSLADEMGEVSKEKDEKIRKLQEQIKQKDEEIERIKKKDSVGELEGKLKQVQEELEQITNELKDSENEQKKNEELIIQLRAGSISNKTFAKIQSERDNLKHQLTDKEHELSKLRGMFNKLCQTHF